MGPKRCWRLRSAAAAAAAAPRPARGALCHCHGPAGACVAASASAGARPPALPRCLCPFLRRSHRVAAASLCTGLPALLPVGHRLSAPRCGRLLRAAIETPDAGSVECMDGSKRCCF